MTMTTSTITQKAAIEQLVIGLTNRAYRYEYESSTRSETQHSRIALQNYVDAAHVALQALGCINLTPAPFGLEMVVREAVRAAGARPPATGPLALHAWRVNLTKAVLAEIGA